MDGVRAVVVGQDGQPVLADVDEPEGPGETVRVLACGLCGSDVEKLTPEHRGTVLGHEVVGETEDGRRVTLVHHLPRGACERCLAGHESTCAAFAAPTIRPGGFAERVRTDAWLELPAAWPDWLGTVVEPLACVLRGAEHVPQGRVLIVGNGFLGRLFGAVLEDRGDEVFAVDVGPRRTGKPPDGPADAAVAPAPAASTRRSTPWCRAAPCSSSRLAERCRATSSTGASSTWWARVLRRRDTCSTRSRNSSSWRSPSRSCCRSSASTRASSCSAREPS